MDNRNGRWIAIFLFGLFVNIFLYHRIGSLGTMLFLAGLWILVIFLFASKKGKEQRKIILKLSIFPVAVLPFTILVGSPMRMAAIIMGSLAWYLLSVYVLLRNYTPQGLLETWLSPFQIIGEYIRSFMKVLSGGAGKETITYVKQSKAKTTMRPYLVGAIVGFPLVILIVSLLSGADPVFSSFVEKILSPEFLQQMPVRVIVFVLTVAFLLPTLFMSLKEKYISPLTFIVKANWKKEMVVILAMVSLVLGAFLVIQWPYVFANVAKETSLAMYGVATYSEYVQRGFGELVIVAGIVFILSWFTLLVSRSKSEDSAQKWLFILQGILGVESVVFVLSIARRLLLYTQYHGMSLARMYGLVFLVWMVGMGVVLAMRFVSNKSYAWLEKFWMILTVFFVIVFNMQKLVVATPPTVNSRVDYVYLSRLSVDGYDGWVKAYSWAKEILERSTGKSGILGSEDRREIWYATLIVDHLRGNYAELAMIYGDRNDLSEVAELNGSRVLKKMDRLLSWNIQQKNILGKMKEEIPFAELNRLDKLGKDLNTRISKQPASEQGFDVDISQSSPVL